MAQRGFFSALAVASAALSLASGTSAAQAGPLGPVAPPAVIGKAGEVPGGGFGLATASVHDVLQVEESAIFEAGRATASAVHPLE